MRITSDADGELYAISMTKTEIAELASEISGTTKAGREFLAAQGDAERRALTRARRYADAVLDLVGAYGRFGIADAALRATVRDAIADQYQRPKPEFEVNADAGGCYKLVPDAPHSRTLMMVTFFGNTELADKVTAQLKGIEL